MRCSRLHDRHFNLEPDLSFMDTTFSDIIYFVNGKSSGGRWKVLQFQITDKGHLKSLDKFIIQYPRKEANDNYSMANNFILELDLKQSLLYTLNRYRKNLVSECSFDLLFRPNRVTPKWVEFEPDRGRPSSLDSFSIDGDLMLFAESVRERDRIETNVYATNLKRSNYSVHLLTVNFMVDVGVLRKKTINDLSAKIVPRFEEAVPKAVSRFSEQVAQRTTTNEPKKSTKLINTSTQPAPTKFSVISSSKIPSQRTVWSQYNARLPSTVAAESTAEVSNKTRSVVFYHTAATQSTAESDVTKEEETISENVEHFQNERIQSTAEPASLLEGITESDNNFLGDAFQLPTENPSEVGVIYNVEDVIREEYPLNQTLTSAASISSRSVSLALRLFSSVDLFLYFFYSFAVKYM